MEFPLVIKNIKQKCLKKGQQTIRRFMSKSGHLNLQLRQVPYSKYFRFTRDFANTLVSIRWRWVIFFLIITNAFFYVCFAGVWMLDAWLSGDFNVTKNGNFCIKATRDFKGYLLLSIETLTTTGYGYLHPTEHCQLTLVIFLLSTIVMILLDGALISVVFLKICKPMKKNGLSLFSKKCVISLRNGKLCLVVRVDDYLNTHLIEMNISMFFLDRSDAKEKNFHVSLSEMEISSSGMFLWPTDVVHEINENSPFWKKSASDLMNNRSVKINYDNNHILGENSYTVFEIVVTLSGTSLVTNQFSTSQTSYISGEILWGYRFKSCMEFDEKLKQYKVNEKDVFKIIPCDTPLCCAKTLRDIENELNKTDEEANS